MEKERARREAARAEKFDARRRIGPVSTLGRLAKCGRVSMVDEGVVYLRAGVGPDSCGRAGLGGLVTCGSVWACPVCSAKITAERAVELTKLIKWNADRGGSVGLLTLTLQHHAGHRLREVRRALTKAWRHMTQSRTWKEDRAGLGMDGYVRAIEATHGDRNGWHLHIHCLLIFDGPVELMRVLAFQEAIWQLWKTGLERQGFQAVREHAVDLRMGEHALEKLGTYINKLAFEAVGGRFKKGHKGGRTPFEILADFLATGLADDYDRWAEWEQGSKGMRQLVWSRGLKVRAGIVQREDEEIAADAEEGVTVAVLSARTWRHVYPVAEQLLTLTERGGAAAALAWLDQRQLAYTVPDVADAAIVAARERLATLVQAWRPDVEITRELLRRSARTVLRT